MRIATLHIATARRRGLDDRAIEKLRTFANAGDDETLTFDADGANYISRQIYLQLHGAVETPAPVGIAAPKPPPRLKPKPAAEWPEWARVVESYREPGEIGVGSTIEKMLSVGGVTFNAAMALIGVACRCDVRKQNYDDLYPYPAVRV